MESKIIAVDFDGTLCENKWPEIGEPNKELIAYLKEQKEAGVKITSWMNGVSSVGGLNNFRTARLLLRIRKKCMLTGKR